MIATTTTYRILGTTDEVTTCDLCGRINLKGTIVLAELDADGNPDGTVYAGSDCGARAAGRTRRDFDNAVRRADAAKLIGSATGEQYDTLLTLILELRELTGLNCLYRGVVERMCRRQFSYNSAAGLVALYRAKAEGLRQA